MLIDDTQPEETRVVVVNGNKLEDVEFESTTRKQIKGNIYLGKIMRVEPSLQACFIDYGGNRHGFMAFGEIHPDYYNVSEEELAEVDKEVDEIIENKKRIAKEIEAQREQRAKEKALAREAALKAREEQAAKEAMDEENLANTGETAPMMISENENISQNQEQSVENTISAEELKVYEEQFIAEEEAKEEEQGKKRTKKRLLKKRFRKQIAINPDEVIAGAEDGKSEEKTLAEDIEEEQPKVVDNDNEETENVYNNQEDDEDEADDNSLDDEIDDNMDFELQRKLIRARKLFHRHKIQDVIKEGQTVLVQVVKEERGNKGAAMTTYLSLAGRYCVLMPNRIIIS